MGPIVIFIMATMILFTACGLPKESNEWLWYNSDESELDYRVQYPANWSVSERGNVTDFIAPDEGNEGRISIVIYDPDKTPPLGVYFTYDTLRVVEKNGEEIFVRSREPSAVTERYFAELKAGRFVVELRFYTAPRYDDIFDNIIITFDYE